MEQVNKCMKLILAAQVPVDLESCWHEGYESSKNSEVYPIIDNPYKLNSKAYHYWNDGFDRGLFCEEPVFKNLHTNSSNKLEPKNSQVHWIYKAAIAVGVIAISTSFLLDLVA
ncbi:hypothetical protein L3V86_08290 [Thiotrichales bacterium 19S11-10]|nr:hypothetical protein [Thiotrichales bacterium 19S11-10]